MRLYINSQKNQKWASDDKIYNLCKKILSCGLWQTIGATTNNNGALRPLSTLNFGG